jgi:hypothetical protein
MAADMPKARECELCDNTVNGQFISKREDTDTRTKGLEVLTPGETEILLHEECLLGLKEPGYDTAAEELKGWLSKRHLPDEPGKLGGGKPEKREEPRWRSRLP